MAGAGVDVDPDHLGAEVIGEHIYRLKFMRGAQVIWIDVDARTGHRVGPR